jgi:hypothetical protein
MTGGRMTDFNLDALLGESECEEKITNSRAGICGWVVRVVGSGSDKSDYHIVHVVEEPGSQAEMLTALTRKLLFCSKCGKNLKRRTIKFPRAGATVWKYREQARKDKASRKWTSNVNSWASQYYDGEGW